MKPIKTLVLVLLIAFTLVGCGHQVEVQKRSTSFPPPALLQVYEVPEPPLASTDYAELPWDDKESLWAAYTSDLLVVIKKHMADKLGIAAWEDSIKKSLEKINAEQQNR